MMKKLEDRDISVLLDNNKNKEEYYHQQNPCHPKDEMTLLLRKLLWISFYCSMYIQIQKGEKKHPNNETWIRG